MFFIGFVWKKTTKIEIEKLSLDLVDRSLDFLKKNVGSTDKLKNILRCLKVVLVKFWTKYEN